MPSRTTSATAPSSAISASSSSTASTPGPSSPAEVDLFEQLVGDLALDCLLDQVFDHGFDHGFDELDLVFDDFVLGFLDGLGHLLDLVGRQRLVGVRCGSSVMGVLTRRTTSGPVG